MNQSMYLKITLLTVISFFNLTVYGQGFPAPSVNVYPAQTKTLAPVAWVSGTVVSRNNSKIAAEVSGRLIELADLGMQVKKGDVIARIDARTLQLKKQEDDAKVESAQSRLTFLNSEVKRKTSLAKRNL